jgi:nicotinamide riboside transporter PnuC
MKLVSWLGSVAGLIGAAMLCLKLEYSGFGYLFFLASSICWLVVSYQARNWSLITLQLGFTATNVIGIARWVV